VSKGLSLEQTQRQERLTAAVSKASKALFSFDTEANSRALKKAEKALAEWSEEVRASNPRYRNLHYPEPYSAVRTQEEICRPGVVVLEYSLGERRSFLWTMNGSHIQMAALPGRAAIEANVAAYRRVISRAPKGGSTVEADQAAARALYNMLVRPAQALLTPASKVLVVPDGILYYLPFETLRSSVTERYLVEDFTISYAPSVSVYANLLAPASGRLQKQLLAFGDPVFGKSTPKMTTPAAGEVRSVYERGGWRLPALPNTRREVEQIGALFPQNDRQIYLGSAATEAVVKQENLTAYRIIHFATHAIMDERTPARSGVVLSLVNAGTEDGVLRMPEIFNLEMNADLVVLSACQTGLGKLVRGEGMIGLTRAFLYAGSRRVVVSLWAVNDLATADFMKSFYEHMEPASPAAALRAAKLAMLHSASPAYRHPYYWAPFVLTGSF
jgi:CHAT domain-containing protein